MFKQTRNWKVLARKLEYFNNLEMIDFLKREGYQQLAGSEHYLISRSVFVINDRIVIKVANNNCGVEQNWAEQQVYESLQDHEKKHFAKLYYHECIGGIANFMEKVKVRSDGIKEFNKAYKTKNEAIRRHGKIAKNINIAYSSDLLTHHNFGVKNGRLVALDYGCSDAVSFMYREARKQHQQNIRPFKKWNNKNFGFKEV